MTAFYLAKTIGRANALAMGESYVVAAEPQKGREGSKASPDAGDTAFIWLTEAGGGCGLANVADVVAVETVPNVRRTLGEPYAGLHMTVQALSDAPAQPLRISEAGMLPYWRELHELIGRQAQDKIVEITPELAERLRARFNNFATG